MQKKFLQTSTVLIVMMCWMCNHASFGGFSVSSSFLDVSGEDPVHHTPITHLTEEEQANLYALTLTDEERDLSVIGFSNADLSEDLSDTSVSPHRGRNYFVMCGSVMILVLCIILFPRSPSHTS